MSWTAENYLAHSAKGTTWKKKDHKYVKKEGKKYVYIYPDGGAEIGNASLNPAYHAIQGMMNSQHNANADNRRREVFEKVKEAKEKRDSMKNPKIETEDVLRAVVDTLAFGVIKAGKSLVDRLSEKGLKAKEKIKNLGAESSAFVKNLWNEIVKG